MKLSECLTEERVVLDFDAKTQADAIGALVGPVVNGVPILYHDAFRSLSCQRGCNKGARQMCFRRLGVLAWLSRSKFGLFVRALREDQDAAAALGVNTTKYKLLVFVITTSMAAMAGAANAHYVGIVTPNALFLLQMSLLVAMAVIGGVENFVAAAIGAIIIQTLLEVLRSASIDIGPIHIDMIYWRLVFFGILLMLTLRFTSNGLIAPIIDYFYRGDVGKETVAKRAQSSSEDEVSS